MHSYLLHLQAGSRWDFTAKSGLKVKNSQQIVNSGVLVLKLSSLIVRMYSCSASNSVKTMSHKMSISGRVVIEDQAILFGMH